MLNKILDMIRKRKTEIISIMALLTIISVLGYIFKDIIETGLVILLILALCNIENITTYFQNRADEKKQKRIEQIAQTQTVQSTLADILFQGFCGQLGQQIRIIAPRVVNDLYPTNIPSVQDINGVTTYRFILPLKPGTQPLTDDVIRRMINGYLRKIPLSGVLPPANENHFHPYFRVMAVTPDTSLPDAIVIHVVYADSFFMDNYIDNAIQEEAVLWQQQLIDTQPPEDEEF